MRFCLAILAVLLVSSLSMAGNVAQQVVTYRIDPINEISINRASNSLVIDIAKDSGKTKGSAVWAITTNETDKRVIGSLDADMPPGVQLVLQLEGPQGAVSKGSVSASSSPQDLVTHISTVAQGDLKIRYRVVAEGGTSRVQLQRVLTLVLTD